MKTAVRYYSRSGNTQALARAVARGAGAEAVPVDREDAPLREPVDLLFVGGALYAYGLDGRLKSYLKDLDGQLVKRAAVFSTSWISRHSVDLIRKALSEKGIPVEERVCYVKNRPTPAQEAEAEAWAKSLL